MQVTHINQLTMRIFASVILYLNIQVYIPYIFIVSLVIYFISHLRSDGVL